MDTKRILDYLSQLSENNNRDWYRAHRDEYRAANAAFEELLRALMLEISRFDGSILHCPPKDLTFKLVRDTRFSRDKSPYNPAFRAHISAKGKQPIPTGYYILLRPEGSFLGGGLFTDLFRDATAMVRDHIAANPEEWARIIHHPEFEPCFTVRGSALKQIPRGYDRNHPQAEFLKFKSWYLEYPVKDEELLNGEQFVSQAARCFARMKPLNDYLNRALAGFELPKR